MTTLKRRLRQLKRPSTTVGTSADTIETLVLHFIFLLVATEAVNMAIAKGS